MRPVQGNNGGNLNGLKHAVIQIALYPPERGYQNRVSNTKTDPPSRHGVALGKAEQLYAYILGPNKSAYRINDDGEPSGSAGKPIHGQLLSYDLTNILVVVIRYFGGTKLGIPGLINAYREATKDALNQADIKEKLVTETLIITYDYPLMDVVMRFIKEKHSH